MIYARGAAGHQALFQMLRTGKVPGGAGGGGWLEIEVKAHSHSTCPFSSDPDF